MIGHVIFLVAHIIIFATYNNSRDGMQSTLLRLRVLPGRQFSSAAEAVLFDRLHVGGARSVREVRFGVVHLQRLLPDEIEIASALHSDDHLYCYAADNLPFGLHLQLLHAQLGRLQDNLST